MNASATSGLPYAARADFTGGGLVYGLDGYAPGDGTQYVTLHVEDHPLGLDMRVLRDGDRPRLAWHRRLHGQELRPEGELNRARKVVRAEFEPCDLHRHPSADTGATDEIVRNFGAAWRDLEEAVGLGTLALPYYSHDAGRVLDMTTDMTEHDPAGPDDERLEVTLALPGFGRSRTLSFTQYELAHNFPRSVVREAAAEVFGDSIKLSVYDERPLVTAWTGSRPNALTVGADDG